MRKLAEKYADSFKRLIALYTVTTQITRKDAAALDIGRNPNTFPKYMKRAARML